MDQGQHILGIERHAWLCTNVILSVVRVGIQSLEFFIELNALFSLSLLIRFYS